MRRCPAFLTASLLCLATLAGCGREAETAPRQAHVPAFAGELQPWDTMPPESIYGAPAIDNLRVQPVELDLLGIPPQWEGMRIAALSDFQLGLWDENEAIATAAVQRAVAARPDVVVLLGDYLGTGTDTAALQRVLAPLRGHSALAVLGDRDVRDDSLAAAIERTLRGQGVQVLRDAAVTIAHGGASAAIAGADGKLAAKTASDQEWILSQVGGGARPALLLTHLPQHAARANGRFPGVLAGNTFCGQVEVPGTPRLSWLATEALPGAAVPGAPQLFRLDDSVMFVTCGLGYGFIPARFGTPPQVALVTLHPVLPRESRPAPRTDSVSIDSLLERYQRQGSTAADTASADTAG
jgi:predicted MPP superfamily phosphohydrolase